MKKLLVICGVATVLGALPVSWSWATPLPMYYVDPENGADSQTCGGTSLATPGVGPCATLNQAMQNGGSGVQIVITRPGTFGPIYVDGNIGISGPPEGQATIAWSATLPGCMGGAPGSCNGNATATYGVDIEANPSALIKLKNVTISNGSGVALHVGTAGTVWMAKDIVRGNGAEQVLFDSSQGSALGLTLEDSEIGLNSTGGCIVFSPSGNTQINAAITDTRIHNGTFGIQANAASGTAILGLNLDHVQMSAFSNSALSLSAPAGSRLALYLARSSLNYSNGATIKANGPGITGLIYETAITQSANSAINLISNPNIGTTNNNTFGAGATCEVNGASTNCASVLSQVGQD